MDWRQRPHEGCLARAPSVTVACTLRSSMIMMAEDQVAGLADAFGVATLSADGPDFIALFKISVIV
jgi:hypothetical protein